MDKFLSGCWIRRRMVNCFGSIWTDTWKRLCGRNIIFLRLPDNFYIYKMDIKKCLREMRENDEWIESVRARAKATGDEKEDVLEILDQIERGFDDIEHRIANMDKEHTKYVRATVTRLNYLLSGETDTKGLVVQLLNRISAEENGAKKEEKLRKTAERMNLSYLEILSEKSLYKRRKSRTDFISKMETEEETEDLNREEVLKMNRIQMRYSRAEIEEFIQAHMTGGYHGCRGNEGYDG